MLFLFKWDFFAKKFPIFPYFLHLYISYVPSTGENANDALSMKSSPTPIPQQFVLAYTPYFHLLMLYYNYLFIFQSCLSKCELPQGRKYHSLLYLWCQHYGRHSLVFAKWLSIWMTAPEILLLAIYLEKTIIQKDTGAQMFTAALFTMARIWKQSKCPSAGEWIKMWCGTYIHGILLSHKKEQNRGINRDMDGPRDYHTEWS